MFGRPGGRDRCILQCPFTPCAREPLLEEEHPGVSGVSRDPAESDRPNLPRRRGLSTFPPHPRPRTRSPPASVCSCSTSTPGRCRRRRCSSRASAGSEGWPWCSWSSWPARGPLLLAYEPSSERAYGSVQSLRDDIVAGGFVRNVHIWPANSLVLVAVLHLAHGTCRFVKHAKRFDCS